MGKIVALISSKGGSGKSTVAVGLATALSYNKKTVLLIDADEGARCLDTLLCVGESTLLDLSDVLSKKAELKEAVINVPGLNRVFVLPSPFDPEPIDFDRLAEVLSCAKEQYDYVLLDTKGQLPASRISKLPHDALFLSVVTPDAIAVKNTGVLTSDLLQQGIECRLVIDRYEKKNSDGRINNIDEIIDSCGSRLIGIVPEDKRISSHRKVPFVYGTAAAAIFRIAARITGQDVPLPKIRDIL